MAKLTPVDRAALLLAMEHARRDPLRAQQLDSFLESRPWVEVAKFAASCCQERALDLPPWQHPPCDITDIEGSLEDNGQGGYRAAARMLAGGVSRWHPDPLRALDETRKAS